MTTIDLEDLLKPLVYVTKPEYFFRPNRLTNGFAWLFGFAWYSRHRWIVYVGPWYCGVEPVQRCYYGNGQPLYAGNHDMPDMSI